MSNRIQTNDQTGTVVLDPGHKLQPASGYTLRDVETIPAPPGKLKWVDGELTRDTAIADADCKPLSPRQFGYLMIGLGVSDAQVEGLISSLISDATARAKALVDYRKAIEFKFSHPLVSMAIAALELDAQDVKATWLEASKA